MFHLILAKTKNDIRESDHPGEAKPMIQFVI